MGRVLDIRGWDNESSRSVANVTWFSGSTNVYRLGHKGYCDIKFVESASGGSYYPEHLPVLGNQTSLVNLLLYFLTYGIWIIKYHEKTLSIFLGQNQEVAVARPVRSGPPPFGVGDKVQVIVNADQLKSMQLGHGGWNPRMAEVRLVLYDS